MSPGHLLLRSWILHVELILCFFFCVTVSCSTPCLGRLMGANSEEPAKGHILDPTGLLLSVGLACAKGSAGWLPEGNLPPEPLSLVILWSSSITGSTVHCGTQTIRMLVYMPHGNEHYLDHGRSHERGIPR